MLYGQSGLIMLCGQWKRVSLSRKKGILGSYSGVSCIVVEAVQKHFLLDEDEETYSFMVHYLQASRECDKMRYTNKPICRAYGQENQPVMLLSCYSESTPLDAVESCILTLMTKTFFSTSVLEYQYTHGRMNWAGLQLSFYIIHTVSFALSAESSLERGVEGMNRLLFSDSRWSL